MNTCITEKEVPLVIATAKRGRDGTWGLTVRSCPFCGQRHYHGGDAGERPSLGDRVGDCGGGVYELVGVAP